MALLPDGALTNVYASLDRYLTEQFVDTGLLTVRFHNQRRFIPPIDDPWTEWTYNFLGLQRDYLRQIRGFSGGEDIFGVQRRGYLQCDIFQRTRVFTQRYSTVRARDVVVNAFPEAGMMGIYDYVNQQPDTDPVKVGLLVFDGVTEHVLTSTTSGALIQRVLEIATRYIEQFTRP